MDGRRMSGSLYRALPSTKRVALLTRLIAERKDVRAVYIARMSKRGGFRPVTLMQWSAPKLAQEVVRMNAQTADDEVDLLQALYVDVEPQIQADFLAAAGVKSEGAVIDESLTAPYASAESVAKAASEILAKHGADAAHYLRVIGRYNPAGWPGIDTVVAGLPAA